MLLYQLGMGPVRLMSNRRKNPPLLRDRLLSAIPNLNIHSPARDINTSIL